MSLNSFVYKNGFSIFSLLLVSAISTACLSPNLIDSTKNSDQERRRKIVQSAQKHIGTKYQYGGKSPAGFDCSGFVYYVMEKNRIQMSSSSSQQSKQGIQLEIAELKPGDLVFFGGKSRISHVGLVVKQSKKELVMIHASSSRGIIQEDIYKSSYWNKRLRFGRSVL